jgi:hypothetical protein
VSKDPLRAMVKPATDHGEAVLAGIAVVVLYYMLLA